MFPGLRPHRKTQMTAGAVISNSVRRATPVPRPVSCSIGPCARRAWVREIVVNAYNAHKGLRYRILASVSSVCRMVGASRFERPTTRTPSECATRLRHAPTFNLSSGSSCRFGTNTVPRTSVSRADQIYGNNAAIASSSRRIRPSSWLIFTDSGGSTSPPISARRRVRAPSIV